MEIPPSAYNPLDTGPKMNVHKTFRRRPGRLLNVLCTFNLHSMSRGKFDPQESHSGIQLPNLRQPTILFKHFIFVQKISLALLNIFPLVSVSGDYLISQI